MPCVDIIVPLQIKHGIICIYDVSSFRSLDWTE